LQSFISGIGNWMADEVLYQVSLLDVLPLICIFLVNFTKLTTISDAVARIKTTPISDYCVAT
jgi:formamidopyrimidine-DNA glycosylase